eukprot:TRINITY_DN5355_c0_g1_i1.p2 TRINITY_DN5355_c0_g1~~TRINITY_DN5355_c0_g1_i1.p2  ORF type:complete len:303 (-),score=40.25 TRINITY_DN5355_c0_g1_i1:55-963(-)
MNKIVRTVAFLALFVAVSLAGFQVTSGPFTKIYNPSVGEPGPWYINDHTFIKDTKGNWHLYGITHAEPPDPENEILFAHATTSVNLTSGWTKQPWALTVDYKYFGETHLWAPHVIMHKGLYYMFYCGGGKDHTHYALSLATSTDLFKWTRLPSGPLFYDGYDARDPYITKINGKWVMYYDGNSTPQGGNHVVLYRTSDDLIHWSDRKIAFTDPEKGTWGGGTESPFVVNYKGSYYLFIGPRGGYVGTDVFKSNNPFNFDIKNRVGHIQSHAAEVIQDGNDWWISAAGWGQGGVFLAKLNWGV